MAPALRRALISVLAASCLLGAGPASAATRGPGKPAFDSRDDTRLPSAAPTSASALRARARLEAGLGRQGLVDIDPRTGTPRTLARLDGYLTAASGTDPLQSVLDYVRSQREVFGLSDDDLAALRLTRRYTDASGVTHVIWAQTWRGITVWSGGLRAAVARDGQIINVGGSPVPGLASRTAAPGIDASQALSEALGDVGHRGLAPRATDHGGADRPTTFTGGHDARLVLFPERRGDVHLAWDVTDRAGPAEVYEHLIDARSGDVLYRDNQVNALTADMSVFEYAPDRSTQGPQSVEVTNTSDLAGPNARAFIDADTTAGPDQTVPANANGNTDWNDPLVLKPGSGCFANPCSWRLGVVDSWKDNRRQATTNLYYFVNTFHDWLRDQVGFTDATGGFEGADRVTAITFVGADNGTGTPSSIDNAFAVTGKDGSNDGTLSFFLWSTGRNSADDATVVYHEYAHLLSNRLVTRPNGSSALGSYQSGAMGEGWSDWYGMDYLVDQGLQSDTPTPGQVAIGSYVQARARGIRRAALDCPVGFDGTNCANTQDTYGDIQGIDVHPDGEIWAQTLWDLRTAMMAADASTGAQKTRRIVTEAMRLSPEDPSYLDMRNAIIQADTTLFAGANRDRIWQVFAARGMGFAAFARDGDDIAPLQDFTLPPAGGTGGTLTGRITDAGTGAPIAGALIDLGNLPGVPAVQTDAAGNYSIPGLPAATYPHATISRPGFELLQRSIVVGAGGGRVDLKLRRNLAAAAGGATIEPGFSEPDFSNLGCGPSQLIDGNLAEGWASKAQDNPDNPGEKSVTIKLPAVSEIAAVRIDPAASCGDDDTASTGQFRVETSGDGVTFTQAAAGTFGTSSNHRLNEITAQRSGVRFVRFVMVRPQSQATGKSGKLFLDSSELEVVGPLPPDPPPAPPAEPAGGAAAVPVDRQAPVGRLALRSGQKLKAALSRGLKVTLTCDEPCSARLRARLDAKTAKKLGLLSRRSRAKSVVVASGSLRMGEGRRTATLKFTRKARSRLKGLRSLKLTVAGPVTDRSGNQQDASRRVTLKR